MAAVQAVFSRDGRTYTNTYTVTRKRQLVTEPSTVKNAEYINTALAAALRRLLGDRELFGLINGG